MPPFQGSFSFPKQWYQLPLCSEHGPPSCTAQHFTRVNALDSHTDHGANVITTPISQEGKGAQRSSAASLREHSWQVVAPELAPRQSGPSASPCTAALGVGAVTLPILQRREQSSKIKYLPQGWTRLGTQAVCQKVLHQIPQTAWG